MSFLSIQFIAFFLLVVVVYYFFSPKWRWLWFLLASYVFFVSWSSEYIFILLTTTIICYLTAILMGRNLKGGRRFLLLIIGLAGCLGPLFYFKYLNYVSWFIAKLFLPYIQDLNLPKARGIAPIGVSFFTLQIVAYLVDVYRNQQEPERHFGRFALFVSFFPQLISGPIGRAKSLIGQYQVIYPPKMDRVRDGFHRILLGAFQKYVIADRIALLVNSVFDQPNEYYGFTLMIAAYLFSIQIYCDFAGYTHIALGISKLLGIELPENFNLPYLAKDFIDFWNRWHISLSTWLRDYIFFPISRLLRKKWNRRDHLTNLILPPIITMLISGLWHGAGINFILWGGIHGIMLFLSNITTEWRRRISEGKGNITQWIFKLIQVVITYHLITLSWIIFRTNSISEAMIFYQKMFAFETLGIEFNSTEILISLVVVVLFVMIEFILYKKNDLVWIKRQRMLVRWSVYLMAIFFFLFMGEFQGSQQFLYALF